MPPAAKQKLPVAGAAALRAKAWAVRWDCPDAWSRKAECGGCPGMQDECCKHAWLRPSVSPPRGPHQGANNWPNKTRHAAKGSLAMQAGAGGLAHAEANDAMRAVACKAGIWAQLEVLCAEADSQRMRAGFRALGSQCGAARWG